MSDSVDLLITGGAVVDGTGAPPRPGTVRRRGRPDAAAPRGRAAPRARRAAHRRHRQGRRARLHRPAQPWRPGDPRRAAPRTQGPPGRHDRDRRRRRQRLRARSRRREDLLDFVDLDSRARRPARTSTTTGARSPTTSPATTARSASTSATLVGNSQLRIARRSAGTTSPADDGSHRPHARHPARRAWPRARSASRSGLDYPPGELRHDRGARGADPDRGRGRRLLPHPRPLLARRPLPRPVPRGHRDRPPCRRARPHHPLLSPRDPPGRPRGRCSPWSTTRAPRAST